MIAEPVNIGYLTTGLSEVILDLHRAMDGLGAIADPEKVKELVNAQEQTAVSNKLVHLISPDRLIVPLGGTEKKKILQEMVGMLHDQGAVENFAGVLKEVLDREATMSTAIGMGIALPHARSEHVSNMVLAVGVHREGIDFESLDGKPVSIVVLIISPKKDTGPHLQVLSSITKLLTNSQLRERMLAASDNRELFALLEQAIRAER